LIVNGKFEMKYFAKVYGVGYITEDWWEGMKDHASIEGGVIVDGRFKISGSAKITYDAGVAEEVGRQIGSFGKIPGSWKDFG
jgi:hypothetical protein